MKRVHTKEMAEAVLRELPSVLGAFVREDVNGHPREIHLLISPGPNPGGLARDVRTLLEERLGIPVDQRVISIAQLAERPADESAPPPAPEAPAVHAPPPAAGLRAAPEPPEWGANVRWEVEPELPADRAAHDPVAESRLVYGGIESLSRGGRVQVCVRISWLGQDFVGVADEMDGERGRVRAAAAAALRAATDACQGRVRLELDSAATVPAFGRDYVVVSALAASPLLGRQPIELAGAQPVEAGAEAAAALAALQAGNRVVGLGLRD